MLIIDSGGLTGKKNTDFTRLQANILQEFRHNKKKKKKKRVRKTSLQKLNNINAVV